MLNKCRFKCCYYLEVQPVWAGKNLVCAMCLNFCVKLITNVIRILKCDHIYWNFGLHASIFNLINATAVSFICASHIIMNSVGATIQISIPGLLTELCHMISWKSDFKTFSFKCSEMGQVTHCIRALFGRCSNYSKQYHTVY